MTDSQASLFSALEAHVDIHGSDDLLGPASETAPANAPTNLFGEPVAKTPDRPVLVEPPKKPGRPGPTDAAYERIAALIPPESPLHGMKTIEEVSAYLRDSILIDLDRTRLNPVFGVGNPNADVMVIGEAPGADEDRLGEPFVGRAGQLLTRILEAIGFSRDDVYIANILKSRPPNNRDPRPDEVAAHIPILYKQMCLIRPKLLLCVGRTAGTSLLQRDASLKSLRGIFHDFHGLETMVTYHPAALLRNPQWKRPAWEDVQLLRQRYDELTSA